LKYDLQGITYKYSGSDRAVLLDVGFSVESGAVTAVVGPSGCGKSTLVNVLSGVIPQLITEGELSGSIGFGEEMMISVVSQSPENQLFGYGVEDAVAFGLENMGLPYEEMNVRIEYVMDLLNIQHLRRRSVATLSGGQRQAVCIASVLVMQPDVLIMDEPCSSLDPNGKKLVQSVLRQLCESGQTTVIVDNNLDWFCGVTDHIVGISGGRVVYDGNRDDFFDNFEAQGRLGVTIPQEAEIYREIRAFTDTGVFYTLEAAKERLRGYAPKASGKEMKNNAPRGEKNTELLTEGVSKTFEDGFHALIDVSAGFEKGKATAILGQNGSGKTTLARHLNGLIKPTSGRVLYMGKDVAGRTVAQISRDIILVFQHPEHMLFEQSVTDELLFCARTQGVEIGNGRAEECLREFGLYDEREELPVNLSMGKKHILTILSVLFSRADVIILDEPTLGMDLHFKNKLTGIIQSLKDGGKTVIVISHEIPMVFRVCDRMVVLDNGKKIFEGDREELLINDEVLAAINIPLPPVVTLSKSLGLDEVACDVPSFAMKIKSLARGDG